MLMILMKLYQEGKIDEANLDIAVNKRWISSEEKELIIKSK